MQELQFRATGLTEETSRRIKEHRKPSRLPAGVLLLIAVIAIAHYVVNHPGQIKIVAPGSTLTTNNVTVQGTVENLRIGSLTLTVNDKTFFVPVENGSFSTPVLLNAGENNIFAYTSGITSNSLKLFWTPLPPVIQISIGSLTNNTAKLTGTVKNTGAGTVTIDTNGRLISAPIHDDLFQADLSL